EPRVAVGAVPDRRDGDLERARLRLREAPREERNLAPRVVARRLRLLQPRDVNGKARQVSATLPGDLRLRAAAPSGAARPAARNATARRTARAVTAERHRRQRHAAATS